MGMGFGGVGVCLELPRAKISEQIFVSRLKEKEFRHEG
jgi:hypothetical protein